MVQRRRPQRPTVPIRYAGLWIAWDRRQTKIVASGQSFAEAKAQANLAGEPEPVLAKVPKAGVRFVGG
jgi:hypothetical protein